jgi:spore protease
MKRTDMAVEFGIDARETSGSEFLRRTVVEVDKAFSDETGKAPGRYITVETSYVRSGQKSGFSKVANEIGEAIRSLITAEDCLIVGLGNPDMTADSLGKRVLDRVLITRHMQTGRDLPSVGGICPNVLGVTGIESYDIVKGVTDRIRPGCVIAVDSLAGATVGRLASAFQVSDAGITPGSGVSNHRARLDKKSLGCPVLSVGVPLVVYASTLIEDATQGTAEFDPLIGSLIVTPKDIDLYVSDCADIIARALNLAFYGDDFADLF